MSADAAVIICVSNECCAEIETVTLDGTGLSTHAPPPLGAVDAGVSKAAGENFPVALRLLPARHRRHLMAVYRFARTVDDVGDEAPPDQRLKLLGELESDLARLYDRTRGTGSAGAAGAGPRSQAVAGLAPAVTECAIPAQLFADLIQANRQDQVVARYQTFDDLLGYCRLSANPVGRIVLHVFGSFTGDRAELSDRVCSALQLAEHWQDVAEDLQAGRIYLPAEDLDRFGVTEQDLALPSAPSQVRALIAFETTRARSLLDEGAPLIGSLQGWARIAVAGYVAGGRAALTAIAAADHDVLRATPRPRKRQVAAELARACARGR